MRRDDLHRIAPFVSWSEQEASSARWITQRCTLSESCTTDELHRLHICSVVPANRRDAHASTIDVPYSLDVTPI